MILRSLTTKIHTGTSRQNPIFISRSPFLVRVENSMIGRATLFAAFAGLVKQASAGECFGDDDFETKFLLEVFALTEEEAAGFTLPEDTCCQEYMCGLPCPEEVSEPDQVYGIVVLCFIALSFLVGLATVFCIKGEAENYFVAGRSLPLWVVTCTLASQSIDSNAILGNVDLSYKYHFFDGFALPFGLGLSLILNGIFLAKHINLDGAKTLPDVYAKRYGKVVEVMVSIATIISFLCLLAGNLVGMGVIIEYLMGWSQQAAIWGSAAMVLAYTIAGGLYSVAYTDVMQATVGWIGCTALAFYMIANSELSAPQQSIGFPGYMYPDDEACALYDGVNCTFDESACCYNEEKYGSGGMDNGAYPVAPDAPVFPKQMTDPHSMSPFPNAIVFNWATIFVLGFGNLAALDFQARCMASKTATTAVIGCLLAGCLTFLVGIPFSYMGAITRVFYGPDSTRAAFETDTCSAILALPTCAAWLPDKQAFIKLLTHEAPNFLGAWCLVGIVAASMSTSDGAILAMGTVFSHNIMRNIGFGSCITNSNLLTIARISSIPFAAGAAAIAAYYNSSHPSGATGYLLIVAFDVVLASVVVPLFGCFYTKKPSPLAAFLSIWAGAITRVILELTLKKDGWLIAPFGGDEFLDYGPAASTGLPPFIDAEDDIKWDSETEPCDQSRFEDWSGVDSLASPMVCLVVFMFVQCLERNGPLIEFSEDGWFAPYLKEGQGGDEYEEKEIEPN